MGFVAEYESSDWFITAAAVAAVTCVDGDVLVANAVCGNQLRDIGISGGGLTWVEHGVVSATARCSTAQWTAVLGSGQGGTFDVTATFSEDGAGGVSVIRFDGIDSVGADAVGDATGPAAPTLDITTTADSSIVVVMVGDHATVDGTARVWDEVDAGTLTETTYYRVNFNNAAYVGYHADAGTAGVKTVGLTAPATMRYSIAAVELLTAMETPSGEGTAELTITTAAAGTKVAAGADTTTLTLASDGVGAATRAGQATVALQLTVDGAGHKTATGSATATFTITSAAAAEQRDVLLTATLGEQDPPTARVGDRRWTAILGAQP